MRKKQKTITWTEYLERGGNVPDMTVVRDAPDFSKDPYFVKKAQAMKEWVDKHGIGEDDDEVKQPKKPTRRRRKA